MQIDGCFRKRTVLFEKIWYDKSMGPFKTCITQERAEKRLEKKVTQKWCRGRGHRQKKWSGFSTGVWTMGGGGDSKLSPPLGGTAYTGGGIFDMGEDIKNLQICKWYTNDTNRLEARFFIHFGTISLLCIWNRNIELYVKLHVFYMWQGVLFFTRNPWKRQTRCKGEFFLWEKTKFAYKQ